MRTMSQNKTATIILFLAPMTIIYCLFAVLPTLGSFYLAFFDWNGVQGSRLEFVGFNNLVNVLINQEFQASILNILWFVFVSVFLQIIVGYMLAFLIHESRRFTRFFKAAFFIPMVLPVTATALLWGVIFRPNDSGILNQFFIGIGLPQLSTTWLIDPSTALNSLVWVNAWASFGYYMIIGLAALAAIPAETIEAATIDGANKLQKINLIMLPLMWETIALSIVMVITGCLKTFDVVFVMTGGGPNGMTNVPSILMYNEAFKYNHFGVGSAMTVVIFLMSLVITMISMRLLNSKESS